MEDQNDNRQQQRVHEAVNPEEAQQQQEVEGFHQPPDRYMPIPQGFQAYQYPPVHQGYVQVPIPRPRSQAIPASMQPFQAFVGPLPQNPQVEEHQPMQGIQPSGPNNQVSRLFNRFFTSVILALT